MEKNELFIIALWIGFGCLGIIWGLKKKDSSLVKLGAFYTGMAVVFLTGYLLWVRKK
ncbi:hypothetical protein [Thermococcus sp. LS2]|uniref:hypothetical protein n=1 Tax=Thermococcus sp. LS2 TaxID=1638260 RepID=UPI00143A8FBC|nr:hypothetical protein [Thermococcus sp. LS2]